MPEIHKVNFQSPVGSIEVIATDKNILSLYFRENTGGEPAKPNALLEECMEQLREYFEGKRQDFDLPLEPSGTDFQLRVWKELLKIPFGTTISYLELARRLGGEKCIRAAGSANGKNPVSVIIPCHRVIGKNGKLIGYGGGLWRKKWLLQHEFRNSSLKF